MASTNKAKARNKRKKLVARIFTVIVVSVMAGGILLATLLSHLY